MTNKLEITREQAQRWLDDMGPEKHETPPSLKRKREELRALLAEDMSNRIKSSACDKCASRPCICTQIAAPVVERQEPVFYVLAKQTAVEVPGQERKELGYTLFDGIGVFHSSEDVHAAITELGLPLGWVSMTVDQLLPGYMMPTYAEQPAPVAVVLPERLTSAELEELEVIEVLLHGQGLSNLAGTMAAARQFIDEIAYSAASTSRAVVLPARKPIEALEFNWTTEDVENTGWNACLDKVKELNQPHTTPADNLRNFANAMIDIALEGADADGGHIQKLAIKHGLLKPERRTERCGDTCSCAEYTDFPVECFRKVKELNQ